MILSPTQGIFKNDIYNAWDTGHKNVLGVSPTGSGKTVVFSDILKDHNGSSCAIAHRQELVTQISLALARDDVPHRIIGPNNVVKLAVNIHMAECGTSYYNPQAPCAVAGVDTLVRRKDNLANWLNSVTKWVQDEAHHVLVNNKWGKAVDMFPNAIGLGVTATPDRADGYGLGRHADGVFDVMVEGPQMRALIDMGYLTDYRVFAPPSDLDLTNVNVTKSGEFSKEPLKAAVNKSHVVGDIVKHYLRIAPGKLGITFVDSVDTATQVAAEYNRAGVPAAVVSADTKDTDRVRIVKEFTARKLMQLVNVDLFGEGFDLPAIEVVSMGRPTQSYALYVQQFGRALRLILGNISRATWDTYTDLQRRLLIAQSTKPHAIIIDHVGNVERHGLPDRPRIWTMDRRERTGKNKPTDDIPTTTCLNPECVSVYERTYKACPYCGHVNLPAFRSGPEFVDGDLTELDAATLAEMRGEIAKVNMTVDEARADMLANWVPKIALTPGIKRHIARQEMQTALRESIAWWGGYQRAAGRDDSESYKRFYWKFGIDVLSAQALNIKDAQTLALKINDDLARLAV
ncbi:MAG: DEAD/DEAH box helicase family protein [candidate division Zixibacteria bacterium]|nr:DEAD/DEAH box helicase family protein [candidate division Zixibacteria bacterium]